jgi:DNA polymerase-3 subunit gamma/tau
MAEALYRKYRPQVFGDVVGQDHIERTLKNAIDQDQVSHAYLFCGPRGTGKTTTARLLAKALLCEHGPTSDPDGTCRECEDVASGTHPDVYELDAASRTGVENVREEIIGRVNFAPTRGKVKVYIIDEVHMLSTAAFNALLKTLEEPPAHVVFILCTTDPQKVPETIHSRCQRFDFRRLSTETIVSRLGAVCMAEDVEFEGDALDLVAHRADGGMRNALTALEQLIAFGEGKVTVKGAEDLLGSLDSTDMAEIITAVGRRDAATCFTWTAAYVESGADLAQFSRDMAERVRNLYVLGLAGTDAALDVPDAERRELSDELALFGSDRLARMLVVLGDLIGELRTSANPRLCFEIALTRMVRPDSDLTLQSLAERIEALESGYSAVATAVPVVAGPAVSQPISSSSAAGSVAPTASSRSASVAAGDSPSAGNQPDATAQPQQAADTAAMQPAAPDAHPAPNVRSAAGGGIAAILSNPAALQRVWRSTVTAVKKEKVSYGVLFVNVKVQADESGQGILVEFPADNPFAFSMASKSDVQDVLKRAIEQAAGASIPFSCVQAKGAAPTQPAANRPAPAARSQHAVRRSNASASAPGPIASVEPPADDDRVPLDAYGDGGYGDGEGGYGGVTVQPPRQVHAPASPVAPMSSVPADKPETPGAGSLEAPVDATDLSKMLSDTMGQSIVFEEVDE